MQKAKKEIKEKEEQEDPFAYLNMGSQVNEDDAWGESKPDYSAQVMQRLSRKNSLTSLLEDKNSEWQTNIGDQLEQEGREVQLVQMHGLWVRR